MPLFAAGSLAAEDPGATRANETGPIVPMPMRPTVAPDAVTVAEGIEAPASRRQAGAPQDSDTLPLKVWLPAIETKDRGTEMDPVPEMAPVKVSACGETPAENVTALAWRSRGSAIVFPDTE